LAVHDPNPTSSNLLIASPSFWRQPQQLRALKLTFLPFPSTSRLLPSPQAA
jgi:hypothetical protein